jgi:hypothetical protein
MMQNYKHGGCANLGKSSIRLAALLLYWVAPEAFSVSGLPLWTNQFPRGGGAYAVAVDNGGNVFAAGYAIGVSASPYAVVAYSGAGAALWTNYYSLGLSALDYANAVVVTGNGNVIVTGTSYSGTCFDYATIAYSNAGLPLWTNRYNGPGGGTDEATAIAVDINANVFVTGTSSGGGSKTDCATVAYSAAGTPLWTNRYNESTLASAQGYDVAVDSNGDVFVAAMGSSGDKAPFFAAIAYSGSGVALWTNHYVGPAGTGDIPSHLVAAREGDVIVTGKSTGTGSGYDYATVKYSNSGVSLWTNRYNGPGSTNDEARGLAVDSSGNVYVTGDSYSGSSPSSADYATVKYSSAGVPLWTNR